MQRDKQVQIGAICFFGLMAVSIPGCNKSESGASSQPTVPAPPLVSTIQPVQKKPTKDYFGIPANFHPSYTLKEDENISLSMQDTRRKVRIIVPTGLSDSGVENNMRVAAERAYHTDGSPHAIIVFAYKPGTDVHMQYTAGRLQWAPGGDWTRADEDVSLDEHEVAIDIADDYRPKPKTKPTSSQNILDAITADADAQERAREANVNRHIPESRRRRIYFAYQRGMQRAMETPNIGDALDDALHENDADIAAKYHVTADELDSIRTEGDELGWPQP